MERKTKFITRPSIAKVMGALLIVALAMVLSMGTGLAFDPPDPRDPAASDLVDLNYIEYMLDEDMPPYNETRGVWDPRPYSGALWDYFQVTDASGTGVFDTYLLLNPGSGIDEKGFNTGGHCDDYDEGDSQTSALPLYAVPIVEIDGTLYREFCADINERGKNNITELISLEVCQIWQSDSMDLCGQFDMDGSLPDYYFPTNPEPYLVYDLDWEHNYTLILDYGVNSGSGKADYKLFVPNSWFNQTLAYVVMVIDHGNIEVQYPEDYADYGNSDGFEEWGVRIVEEATGCLEVQKVVNPLDPTGANYTPDATFEVTITGVSAGASYPGGYGLIFNLTDGVLYVDADNDGYVDDEGDSYCLCGLMPGNYTATETPPDGWEAANITGSPPEDLPDASFTINVAGPSYPASGGGLDLVFNFTDGVVTGPEDGNSTCICGLIPGNYTVTEGAVTGWKAANITNDDPAVVAAGDTCGVNATIVTVTTTSRYRGVWR